MQRIKRAFERTFPSIGCAFFLIMLAIGLEYVFQTSKVSYLSRLNGLERVVLLANSAFILFVLAIALWIPIVALILVFDKHNKIHHAIVSICLFLCCLGYFALLLLHLDSALYTATGWNVYAFPYIANLALILVAIDISILTIKIRGQRIVDFFSGNRKKLSLAMMTCFLGAFACFAWNGFAGLRSEPRVFIMGTLDNAPNIILFSADALDGRHLGVYGYGEDTTSNLERLSGFTKYTRAYTNAGQTAGSTTSILTGKSPLTTKLITAPDILTGDDSFEHLPNILSRLGYYCVDLNDGWWASASRGNLRSGFHMENGQETGYYVLSSMGEKFNHIFSLEMYFLSDSLERHSNKISYMVYRSSRVFFSRPMLALKQRGGAWPSADVRIIDTTKSVIREIDQPLFIRIHLLDTHPFFFGRGHFGWANNKVQLKYGTEEEKKNILTLYDKAVSSIDGYFGEIIQTLEDTGKMENTLIIFHTDHWQKHDTASQIDRVIHPLPLIVHLPGQEEMAIFEEPVQYLDIAPSIVALLGQPIPEWMEGEVIFGENVDKSRLSTRPIIAETTDEQARKRGECGPPLYGVDMFSLIADNRCYIYSTISDPGGLYDISGDPYDFRPLDDPTLVRHYHDMLRLELEKKGIIIEENPS